MAGFVFVRVKARTLTRSRQEWRYALRTAPADREIVEALAGAEPAPDSAGVAFESLGRALAQLEEMQRWLLDQLFWQHRTEADIAAELHISQPAVSKRKHAALVHLRTLL
jgi:DNA-directed RNA polymerase specialized sigma24 family protein